MADEGGSWSEEGRRIDTVHVCVQYPTEHRTRMLVHFDTPADLFSVIFYQEHRMVGTNRGRDWGFAPLQTKQFVHVSMTAAVMGCHKCLFAYTSLIHTSTALEQHQ